MGLADGTEGRFREGEIPEATGDAELGAPTEASAITGGTTAISIDVPEGADKLYASVDGAEGYWEVDLPEGVDEEELLVTWGEDLSENINVRVAVVGADGEVSGSQVIATSTTTVGSGDVQVSVSWNGDVDIDLHVVDPNGFEVYFEQRSSPEGGGLDLDSNSMCSIDKINNENIVWPAGLAPRGEYVVRVDLFNNCAGVASRYAVTVKVGDEAPEVFTGSFSADEPGSLGGLGDGVEIARFMFP